MGPVGWVVAVDSAVGSSLTSSLTVGGGDGDEAGDESGDSGARRPGTGIPKVLAYEVEVIVVGVCKAG